MGLDQDRPGGVPGAAAVARGFALPVAMVLASLLAEAGGDAVRDVLRYGRLPIADGEWWRLVTGHLVHLGWSHYLMNAVALLLIWALVGHHLGWRSWLLVLGIVVAVIDLGFWFIDTALYWYVGLSGVLHGMLAAGLLAGARQAPVEAWVVGGLLLVKLGWEQVFGAIPGSEASAGGTVVVNAHLYGTVAGAAAALALAVRRRQRASL